MGVQKKEGRKVTSMVNIPIKTSKYLFIYLLKIDIFVCILVEKLLIIITNLICK